MRGIRQTPAAEPGSILASGEGGGCLMGLRGPAAVNLSMPVRGEHLGSIFSVGRRRGTA
jgi:hypothetical protein